MLLMTLDASHLALKGYPGGSRLEEFSLPWGSAGLGLLEVADGVLLAALARLPGIAPRATPLRGWRRVILPRMILIFSTSWIPSGGFGFFSLINTS